MIHKNQRPPRISLLESRRHKPQDRDIHTCNPSGLLSMPPDSDTTYVSLLIGWIHSCFSASILWQN